MQVQQHYVKPQPNELSETVLTDDCKQETGLQEEVIKNSHPLEHVLDEVGRLGKGGGVSKSHIQWNTSWTRWVDWGKGGGYQNLISSGTRSRRGEVYWEGGRGSSKLSSPGTRPRRGEVYWEGGGGRGAGGHQNCHPLEHVLDEVSS